MLTLFGAGTQSTVDAITKYVFFKANARRVVGFGCRRLLTGARRLNSLTWYILMLGCMIERLAERAVATCGQAATT